MGEAHNVCKACVGITKGFYDNKGRFYIVMEYMLRTSSMIHAVCEHIWWML